MTVSSNHSHNPTAITLAVVYQKSEKVGPAHRSLYKADWNIWSIEGEDRSSYFYNVDIWVERAIWVFSPFYGWGSYSRNWWNWAHCNCYRSFFLLTKFEFFYSVQFTFLSYVWLLRELQGNKKEFLFLLVSFILWGKHQRKFFAFVFMVYCLVSRSLDCNVECFFQLVIVTVYWL